MIVLYNINLIYNLDTVKEENKMLSKQQIQYYEKQYLTCFSDREKATIIFNDPQASLDDILLELIKIECLTSDSNLKKEIEERISYEIFKYQDFVSNNQQNYLYCLMDEDEFIYGVYESFYLAYDNLKQKVHEDLNDDFFLKSGYKSEYQIQKYKLTKTRQNSTFECLKEIKKSETQFQSAFIGNIQYKENLNIQSVFYNNAEPGYLDNSNRFENQFIGIYIPFQKGDIVKCLTNQLKEEVYYVVEKGAKEFKDVHSMLKGSEDYSDCALCVYELSENGSWNHHHLNPLYLKKICIQDQTLSSVYQVMSDYCKGDKTEDDVLKATIDYEKHKIEQKIINQKYFIF